MLHEILLSLSGHPSPLLQSTSSGKHTLDSKFQDVLSPPEAALLSSLAHLSSIHQKLLSHTTSISSSHPSIVCRAVSASIVSDPLAKFQDKILDVEKGILKKDASLVGAYDIVPLSRMVAEFDSWIRPMDWLWDVSQFMLPINSTGEEKSQLIARGDPCSGAAIIDKLREEAQTGFPDLEAVALHLLRAAETAWLRQLSTWVLYGRLPAFGADDFFIQAENDANKHGSADFAIVPRLSPSIVTPSTVSSILFIGRSLNHIRARGSTLESSASSSATPSELALLPRHLQMLSALSSPITPSRLSSAIAAIRTSLSRNTLQQLLPLSKILEVLHVLRDYYLLARGEFAVAFITEADRQMRARSRRSGQPSLDKGPEHLGAVLIKEGEVNAVFARTWATLSSLQSVSDDGDEEVDLARDLLNLSISKSSSSASTPRSAHYRNGTDDLYAMSDVQFNNLLLSTPTAMSLQIHSPLDLFLTTRDIDVYSCIQAYLLAIRRGHLRLTSLWKDTFLRRDHPAPLGPPYSNTPTGQTTMQGRRSRSNKRAERMRKVWATNGAAAFLLAELGEYFQGEVVRGSWEGFRAWLDMSSPSSNRDAGNIDQEGKMRPLGQAGKADGVEKSVTGDQQTSGTTSTNIPQHDQDLTGARIRTPHDPETLSRAHQIYLSTLLGSLFLTDQGFTKHLRVFLGLIDQLVTCIARLQQVWQMLDLEMDEGVVDSLVDTEREEREVLRSLESVRGNVQTGVRALVARLRELDAERAGGGRHGGGGGGGGGETVEGFVPWRGGGVDRLLMKLDFGSFGADEAETVGSGGDGAFE